MVEISDRIKRLALEGGWIGVDMDGTLFTYDKWIRWDLFGEPIAPMVDRVKGWLAARVPVKIVTARIGLPWQRTEAGMYVYSGKLTNKCKLTGAYFSDSMMAQAVQSHLASHGLPKLPVQCFKDYNMIELWDDRAIQVVANTGITLAEAHRSEIAALEGKAQGTVESRLDTSAVFE